MRNPKYQWAEDESGACRPAELLLLLGSIAVLGIWVWGLIDCLSWLVRLVLS